MKQKLIHALGQSTNLFVIAPITLLAPRWYFRALFEIVRAQHLDWGSKQAGVTVSFDCDYRADIEALPALLDFLATDSWAFGFACVGKWIEAYPDVHRAILEAGHEIMNHTYTHPNNVELGVSQKFNALSAAEQEAEIVRCHEVCQSYLNYEPTGFRIPHFGALYTPTVYTILAKSGYTYSSSLVAARSAAGGAPFVTDQGVLEFPVSPCPAHPFGILDTHHAFRKNRAWHRQPGAFAALFEELLEIGIQTHAHINLYFDPQDVMRYEDARQVFAVLRERRDEVHVLSYAEMVSRFVFPTISAK